MNLQESIRNDSNKINEENVSANSFWKFSMRDQIFSKKTDLVDFTFDAQVANVFDNMVRRSVPGYQTLIECWGY